MTKDAAERVAILYTRPGCPLCFTLRRAAGRQARRHGFTLRVVDVSVDPELLARYGTEVPVLHLPGGPTLQGRVDPASLEAAFSTAGRALVGPGLRGGPQGRRAGALARLLTALRRKGHGR